MADINKLKESVRKAEEKVEKCKKTIERHKSQLEKKIKNGADNYDIKWKKQDIDGATKKLKQAEATLDNWQQKLNLEIEKERFLNDNAPQAIKDFLEDWKCKAYDWHVKKYDAYQIFKKELAEEVKKVIRELGVKDGFFPNREQEKALKEKRLSYDIIESRKKAFAGMIVLQMCTYRNEAERLAWLDKTLEEEKKAKMLDLINRINKVVGTITNASLLRVSEKGNLDGFIDGENGRAKVETIGAGGYAVQCFHYRTLVNKIKTVDKR